MEAAVLMGLVGIGQLINKNNENNNPVVPSEVNKDIIMDNSGVYDSNFYEQAQEHVNREATLKFEESQNPDQTGVHNNQNLNRMGSSDLVDDEFEQNKVDLSNMTYSSAAGGYISKEEFMANDQGISMEPFFSHAPTPVNLDDSRQLNLHQGNDGFYKKKSELPNMFKPEKENIHGNHFGEYIGDKTRYVESNLKTNEF